MVASIHSVAEPGATSEVEDAEVDLSDTERHLRYAVMGFLLAVSVEASGIVVRNVVEPGTWGTSEPTAASVGVSDRSNSAETPEGGWLDLLLTLGGIGCLLLLGAILFLRVDVDEQRRRLRRLRLRRARALTNGMGSIEAYRSRYREILPETIAEYRVRAARWRNANQGIQLLVLVASLAASLVIATTAETTAGRVAAIVLNGIVSLVTAISGFLKTRERALDYSSVANRLEFELESHRLALHDYAGLDEDRRLALLVERAMGICQVQRQRDVEFENIDVGSEAVQTT